MDGQVSAFSVPFFARLSVPRCTTLTQAHDSSIMPKPTTNLNREAPPQRGDVN
jgi:hypothetical protein